MHEYINWLYIFLHLKVGMMTGFFSIDSSFLWLTIIFPVLVSARQSYSLLSPSFCWTNRIKLKWYIWKLMYHTIQKEFSSHFAASDFINISWDQSLERVPHQDKVKIVLRNVLKFFWGFWCHSEHCSVGQIFLYMFTAVFQFHEKSLPWGRCNYR